MKWTNYKCQLSDAFLAEVWKEDGRAWCTRVTADWSPIWGQTCFETEAAAKAAVAAWIGKTMAQLGNALAAGETYPDDGA
jgi:hypothetical protein